MDQKIFNIGGITIDLQSDLPITEETFAPKFIPFEGAGATSDKITLSHYFHKEKPECVQLGESIYHVPPWSVTAHKATFVYKWIRKDPPYHNYYQTVVTDRKHTFLDIYNDSAKKEMFRKGNLASLTMFPTDQIFLGRALAFLNGAIIHSVGIIHNGKGYLFVGHSDAGKSTMATMLQDQATILCDDRNIVRKVGNDYRLFGTWSHGDVPLVSGASAKLEAIFFLEQSPSDQIVPLSDHFTCFERLLACLIRPLATKDWWDLSVDIVDGIVESVPCYIAQFTRSGTFVNTLEKFTETGIRSEQT